MICSFINQEKCEKQSLNRKSNRDFESDSQIESQIWRIVTPYVRLCSPNMDVKGNTVVSLQIKFDEIESKY